MKAIKVAIIEDINRNDIPIDYKLGAILVMNQIKLQEEAN